MAARRQKDVGRFEVAMNDALRVSRIQGVGDLDPHVEKLAGLEPPLSDQVPECPSFQQLHDHVLTAIVFADIVRSTDVGMVQRRRGTRLALKAVNRLSVVRELDREEFQRHLTRQPGIVRLVDDAHAALAELRDNKVMGDCLANH